jgi:hypothetical protein
MPAVQVVAWRSISRACSRTPRTGQTARIDPIAVAVGSCGSIEANWRQFCLRPCQPCGRCALSRVRRGPRCGAITTFFIFPSPFSAFTSLGSSRRDDTRRPLRCSQDSQDRKMLYPALSCPHLILPDEVAPPQAYHTVEECDVQLPRSLHEWVAH